MGRQKLKLMPKAGQEAGPKQLKHSGEKITLTTPVQVPTHWIPSGRTFVATQNGCERNILFNTWGGLGDQTCAEPAIRYALREFKDCKFTLASEQPDLFQHLFPKFERVFNLKEEQPILG